MELVCLWVNNYKNLNGCYTLSAKYKIEPEVETFKVSYSENYLNNFFDPAGKINISAIIGENGCGKTSILKIITKLLYDNHSREKRSSTQTIATLLLEIDGEFHYVSSADRLPIKIVFSEKIKYKQRIKALIKPVYTIYFNYMLDSLKVNRHR